MLYNECGEYASFLNCFFWYRQWIDNQLSINKSAELALGNIAFTTLVPIKLNNFVDITCILPYYYPIIDRLCRYSGYSYEIVEKWGGVYNVLYFRNRIMQQLKRNKPVIFLGSPYDQKWHILIDYDEDKGAIQYFTNQGIEEATDWYDHMECFILLDDNLPFGKTDFCTDTIIRQALIEKAQAIPEFYIDDKAYDIWLKITDDQKYMDLNLLLFKRILATRRNIYHLLKQLLIQYSDMNIKIYLAIEALENLFMITTEVDSSLNQKFREGINLDRQVMQRLIHVFL